MQSVEGRTLGTARPRWIAVMAVMAVAAVAGLIAVANAGSPPSPNKGKRETMFSSKTYKKAPDEQLKRSLTPIQYEVTRQNGTEPPFHNAFWDNHEPGLYVDVTTGEPLFSSTDKFDSGTGWPSFTRPVEPARVEDRRDASHGMARTEVRSRGGDAHLGHVFDDGPAPTGLRYCINSAALRFVPAARLAAEGYGDYRALFGVVVKETPAAGAKETPATGVPVASSVAVLAGGCFWGMEELLRQVPGVISTEAGYTGGKTPNPKYSDLHDGTTGHAEAVRVVFDPRKLLYADLLDKWFFRMHDPTTRNRQGNDLGTQYRSAIFVTSAEQRKIAEEAKARAARSGRWKNPVVTEIVDAGTFTRAEEHHQKYLQKNPGGYTCHFMRN